MGSPSPIENVKTVSIDVPDAVLRKNLQNAAEAREQFISAITSDNGNVKHVIRVPAYPGQAKQIVIATESGVTRILDEVGDPLDKTTVKLHQSAPSTSGEIALVEGHKSLTAGSIIENKIDVGQREVSDMRSNIQSADVDLSASDDREIQSGHSNFSEMVPKGSRRSTTESVMSKETREISNMIFKTEIADIDLGANENREIIVKIQPGPSSYSALVLKEDYTSTTESIKCKTEAGQIEVSDLRIKTEIKDVDLSLKDGHKIMKIQSNQSSSNELQLSECCWLTRESSANDAIEIDNREITFKKERDIGSDNSIDELPIVSKIYLDQINFSKVTPIKNTRLIENVSKEKIDVNNKETNFKGEKTINIGSDFIDADDVVKVQPTHISQSVMVMKDYSLKKDEIKTELDKRQIKSEEHSELSEINKYHRKLDELSPERIAKAAISSPNASVTLDGRHECALSDFRIDKEDYQLSKYCLDEDEGKEEKPLHKTKSNSIKYLDDQIENVINNTVEFASDSKKNDILVSAMIHKSREENHESSTTREADDREMSFEELNLSRIAYKRSSEAEEDGKSDIEEKESIEESFKTSREMDRASKMEKESGLTMHSAGSLTSCDPNLVINGKYLKSIVTSRKSPRKVREGEVEKKELKDQQELQSKVFRSSSVKTKSSGITEEDQIYDAEINIKGKDRIISDREISRVGEVFQSSSRANSLKTKSSRKVEQQFNENDREFKDQNKSIDDRETSRSEKVFQNSSRTASTKIKSSRKVEGFQISENERNFNDQNKSISDQTSQKSSKTKSSPKKEKQIRHKSGIMKDYDRSVNDRVISQLEEVFQNSSKKSFAKMESPKNVREDIDVKNQNRSAKESLEEFSHQHSLKTSTKNPKKSQGQKNLKTDSKKMADRTKQDEFKDVYTRKVRRYNVPLKGSLDSMIVPDEASVQKPKKDDAFAKKSKSYESIKRIQEVFLGMPNTTSNSGSQLDIPDDFCSICCYMNEITFRTEEEISSPNQETFYTLRSACSSFADDDDSIECDICSSLNLQKSTDNLEDKILIDSAHGEIECELCRICDEVDDTFEPDSVVLADKYAFKVIKSIQDDDDSFEIENCGFQSGTESADDRSRVSEKERIKEHGRSNSQSLFIHGSSKIRDQPRELYLIPKDEIAILMSGTRKASRKGSLFRKKENLSENARDNRRYSSMDNLQSTKMPVKLDKTLKIARNPIIAGSADNLRTLPKDSRRSKSLQRLVDDAGHLPLLDSSTDNLKSERKEDDTAQTSVNLSQKSNIRDKEEVKMILTQHGIKIISEKETAL